MPSRAPSICCHPGCNALTVGRYCPEHKAQAEERARQRAAEQAKDRNARGYNNASTTERGYGWRWQKIRQTILRRDCHLCQVCREKGIFRPGNEVDHIIPKSRGGTDDPDNLRTICTECHRDKTARERRRRRGGG